MPSEIPATIAQGQPHSASARHLVEQSLKDNNVRVTAFPSPLAGVPMQGPNEHNEQHQAYLGNKPNPYAPFASKLDWEFACWAKQHGPGSNAISELLQVDGVSFIFTDHILEQI